MPLPDLGTTHGLSELQHPQDNPDVTVNDIRDQLGIMLGAARLVKNLVSDADYTLSTAAGTREDLYSLVKITDTGAVLSTGRNIVVPVGVMARHIENATAKTLTVKTPSGSGVALAAGHKGWLLCDGVDVVNLLSDVSVTLPAGYDEIEVGPVDASGGTADIDYSAGNIQRVTIGDGVDTTLTFTNLPTGKSCSATLRLEMAGAVPSAITLQGVSVDLTDVTSSGEVLVEALRIGTTWYIGPHHAS